jgi:hypothetical protein
LTGVNWPSIINISVSITCLLLDYFQQLKNSFLLTNKLANFCDPIDSCFSGNLLLFHLITGTTANKKFESHRLSSTYEQSTEISASKGNKQSLLATLYFCDKSETPFGRGAKPPRKITHKTTKFTDQAIDEQFHCRLIGFSFNQQDSSRSNTGSNLVQHTLRAASSGGAHLVLCNFARYNSIFAPPLQFHLVPTRASFIVLSFLRLSTKAKNI